MTPVSPDYKFLDTDATTELSSEETLRALEKFENREKVWENIQKLVKEPHNKESKESNDHIKSLCEQSIKNLVTSDTPLTTKLLDMRWKDNGKKWGMQYFASDPTEKITSAQMSYYGVLCLYDQLNGKTDNTSGRGYFEDAQYWLRDFQKSAGVEGQVPKVEEKSKEETEKKAKEAADAKAILEAEAKAKEEAKANEEAKVKAQKEAEEKAKADAERKAKEDAKIPQFGSTIKTSSGQPVDNNSLTASAAKQVVPPVKVNFNPVSQPSIVAKKNDVFIITPPSGNNEVEIVNTFNPTLPTNNKTLGDNAPFNPTIPNTNASQNVAAPVNLGTNTIPETTAKQPHGHANFDSTTILTTDKKSAAPVNLGVTTEKEQPQTATTQPIVPPEVLVNKPQEKEITPLNLDALNTPTVLVTLDVTFDQLKASLNKINDLSLKSKIVEYLSVGKSKEAMALVGMREGSIFPQNKIPSDGKITKDILKNFEKPNRYLWDYAKILDPKNTQKLHNEFYEDTELPQSVKDAYLGFVWNDLIELGETEQTLQQKFGNGIHKPNKIIDSHDKNYVIACKTNAQVYLFSHDHKLLAVKSSVLGEYNDYDSYKEQPVKKRNPTTKKYESGNPILQVFKNGTGWIDWNTTPNGSKNVIPHITPTIIYDVSYKAPTKGTEDETSYDYMINLSPSIQEKTALYSPIEITPKGTKKSYISVSFHTPYKPNMAIRVKGIETRDASKYLSNGCFNMSDNYFSEIYDHLDKGGIVQVVR